LTPNSCDLCPGSEGKLKQDKDDSTTVTKQPAKSKQRGRLQPSQQQAETNLSRQATKQSFDPKNLEE